MKKNIISYSLWGSNLMYWNGALENIKINNNLLPGWISRFYIDKNSDQSLIDTINGDNVEVILIESKDSFHGEFWRFNASAEEDVNIFLSRDCDSRIGQRELSAINEWLESDKDFHIMRDHPYHTVPILAGMWGARNGIMRDINILEHINNWNKYSRKGMDQDFLGEIVYPLVINRALEHSEFGLRYGGNIKRFPTIRENYEFVGDVYDENNNRHNGYWRIIERQEKYGR